MRSLEEIAKAVHGQIECKPVTEDTENWDRCLAAMPRDTYAPWDYKSSVLRYQEAYFCGAYKENLDMSMVLYRGGKPVGIKVDEKMRTNIPGVYAAGDVTGFSMLAHTASREGEVAVNNIAGKPDRMRYNAIPGVVYTNPEVAGVGLTEA